MTNMNQNGRSMIEMLGVLAIIGVLSVGGIAGYSKAMLKFRTNKTLDQISMVVTNIRTLYAQQRNFNGLDNTSAINMGVIPDEMQKNGGIYNAFNGAVNIAQSNSTDAATDKSGEGRAFIVSFNNLPKQACVEMAVNDWGSNYSSGLIGMAIAKESDTPVAQNETQTKFAADVSGAYVGCGGTSTSNGYTKTDANAAATEAFTGTNTTPNAGWTKTTSAGIMVCAAAMPLNVATAASACDCEGNECSISFKYY